MWKIEWHWYEKSWSGKRWRVLRSRIVLLNLNSNLDLDGQLNQNSMIERLPHVRA